MGVVFLPLFASGCATSGKAVAVRPTLPQAPAALTKTCPDPGVDEDAYKAISDNRYWAACLSRKNRDWARFYATVIKG